MFRALTCPFSGGQIVLSQHLVSWLSKRLYRKWRYQMLW